MAPKRVKRNEVKNSNLSREEKAVFLLLIVISILGISFGFKSFSASVSRPFEIQLSKYADQNFMTLSEREAAELELQKVSDSDVDGLTDYDELYVYKTSPYLTDSDSDGFDDQTEIFSDHNPNCPEGRDCSSSTLASADEVAGESNGGALSNLLGLSGSFPDPSAAGSSGGFAEYFARMSAEQIRSLLISQGVPKESVDAMTDDEVMALFQEALAEAEASGELDSTLGQTEESIDSAVAADE